MEKDNPAVIASNTEEYSRETCLLLWINLTANKKLKCLGDLRDGIALFEIMNGINAEIFDLREMNTQAGSEWTLCLSNLRKLYNGLQIFYQTVYIYIYIYIYRNWLSHLMKVTWTAT